MSRRVKSGMATREVDVVLNEMGAQMFTETPVKRRAHDSAEVGNRTTLSVVRSRPAMARLATRGNRR